MTRFAKKRNYAKVSGRSTNTVISTYEILGQFILVCGCRDMNSILKMSCEQLTPSFDIHCRETSAAVDQIVLSESERERQVNATHTG